MPTAQPSYPSGPAYSPGSAGFWTDPTTGNRSYLDATGKGVATPPGLTEPLYQTTPLGTVNKYNTTTGAWDQAGEVNQYPNDLRRTAINGLIDSLSRTNGVSGYSPATVSGADFIPSPMPSGTAFDPAAEAAIYGKAKEKIGQEGSAALKSLRGALASRGITGGGSERALTSDVYNRMQGELSDTDRAIATDSANKAWQAEQMNSEQGFEAGQSNAARNEQVQEFNATAKNAAALQAQQLQQSRMAQLIAAFGSLY